ncbi:phage tail tape measure protein, partial [Pseudomonas helleri]
GNRLEQFASSTGDIDNAKGVIEKDLADNLNSSTAVGSRMKATLGQAIDRMATPLNKGFADIGSYLLDDLNLSGEQMLAGGAALGLGGYYAGRGAKAGAGALFNKFLGGADTLKNIAVGKVLEEATGTTSVFVTNWPTGMGGVNSPDINVGGRKGRGIGRIPWAMAGRMGAGLSLIYAYTQLENSTGLNTDQDRLAMVARDKLLNDGQRTYQTSYYRNRISLLDQNPNQSSSWASEQARRLAQNETGLTAAGSSVEGANSWAAGVANRAVDSGMATIAAAKRLNELLGKPLVIELRTDSDHIFAEVERRLDIQLRRGQ